MKPILVALAVVISTAPFLVGCYFPGHHGTVETTVGTMMPTASCAPDAGAPQQPVVAKDGGR